jgi:hypothetical protein
LGLVDVKDMTVSLRARKFSWNEREVNSIKELNRNMNVHLDRKTEKEERKK